jgi:hypothetical protein
MGDRDDGRCRDGKSGFCFHRQRRTAGVGTWSRFRRSEITVRQSTGSDSGISDKITGTPKAANVVSVLSSIQALG